MSKEIQLTQGFIAIVDDEDYDRLMQWKWHYESGYARRNGRDGKKRTHIRMHRQIMGAREGDEVDHFDLNKLNNCKANLRIVTHNQNQHNQKKYSNNLSGFKGVSWESDRQKWRAQIKVNGKVIRIGSFERAEDAAKAYKDAAIRLHGEFARTD